MGRTDGGGCAGLVVVVVVIIRNGLFSQIHWWTEKVLFTILFTRTSAQRCRIYCRALKRGRKIIFPFTFTFTSVSASVRVSRGRRRETGGARGTYDIPAFETVCFPC